MTRLLAPSLLVLGLLSGCVKAPIEGRQDPYAPSQIMFASKDLRNNTAVSAPSVAPHTRCAAIISACWRLVPCT